MSKIRNIVVSFFLLLLPRYIGKILSKIVFNGCELSVGFSWVYCDWTNTNGSITVGHLNYITVSNIQLVGKSRIGNMNFIVGNFTIKLNEKSSIGNRNVITRAKPGVSYGYSELSLGKNTKLTAGHKLDMMRTIKFSSNSILAGLGSQLWTHGYFHLKSGERCRIDGEIEIGSNVYIGSMCIINAGITVKDNISIGSGSVISKSIENEGLYVSQPLRFVEKEMNTMPNLEEILDKELCERVFRKN